MKIAAIGWQRWHGAMVVAASAMAKAKIISAAAKMAAAISVSEKHHRRKSAGIAVCASTKHSNNALSA